MSILVDLNELNNKRGNELISCTCNNCGANQQRKVVYVRTAIKRGYERFLCKRCVRMLHTVERCSVICKNCNNVFTSRSAEHRKFCSSSCAATYSNLHRSPKPKDSQTHNLNIGNKIHTITTTTIDSYTSKPVATREMQCKHCGKTFISYIRRNAVYCSTLCAQQARKVSPAIFSEIESGSDLRHISDCFVTRHSWFKKYLIYKHGEKCMRCGWKVLNTFTGKVPIELEHKDGNCDNDNISNLELLCPNCHSLTSTYKGANKNKAGSSRYKYWKKSFSNRLDVIKLDLT